MGVPEGRAGPDPHDRPDRRTIPPLPSGSPRPDGRAQLAALRRGHHLDESDTEPGQVLEATGWLPARSRRG